MTRRVKTAETSERLVVKDGYGGVGGCRPRDWHVIEWVSGVNYSSWFVFGMWDLGKG